MASYDTIPWPWHTDRGNYNILEFFSVFLMHYYYCMSYDNGSKLIDAVIV